MKYETHGLKLDVDVLLFLLQKNASNPTIVFFHKDECSILNLGHLAQIKLMLLHGGNLHGANGTEPKWVLC